MKIINPQLLKLVSILNDGGMHDGDTLGEALCLSRAAVWKMIKKLKDLGVAIHSTKAKGYQLRTPLFLLSENKIRHALASLPVTVTCLESITSTNDYFKGRKETSESTLDVCVAEMQTKGRGRLGRSWFSPFGQNLYLSCRYFFSRDISELGGLSLVVGISIVDALKRMGFDEGILVKWPNDIMVMQKKLAGILIEVRAEAHGLSEVVIGIGMNVNLSSDHHAAIKQAVTALCELAHQWVDRNELVIALLKQLYVDLRLFQESGVQIFQERFAALDYLKGKMITLLQGEKIRRGIASGVNEQGYLLLQEESGQCLAFSSGEASVGK